MNVPWRFWVMRCIICGKGYQHWMPWQRHILRHIAQGVPSTDRLWHPPAFEECSQ